MERVRLVEDAVLKTVGCKNLGGSIPFFSAAVSLTVLLPAGSSKENETDRAYVHVQALGDPTSKT